MKDTSFAPLKDILALVATGAVSGKEYRHHLAVLEDTKDPGNLEWLQGWILLHCASGKKAFKTRRFLSKYGRMCRRKDRYAEYEQFMILIQDDLGLFLPAASGYSKTFKDADLDVVFQDCHDLIDRLGSRGLAVFANSGTLLGIAREGSFLKHDNDIDLAVLLDATSEAEAAREWISVCNDLIAAGIALERSTWSTVTLKLSKIGDFGADLFPAWLDTEKRLFVYPHTYGTLAKSDLLPLGRDSGTGLPIPNAPAAMMVSNYGEGWKVPDQGWVFKWPEANEKFHAFLSEIRTEDAE